MPNKLGFAQGPVGETIFHSPFFSHLGRVNELPYLFRQVEGLHDHRLLGLVSALVLEERIDKLLSSFFPRYNVLTDSSEFGFSAKIKMLEALCFIPKHLTEGSHILRLVRNDFAHHLDKTKLSHVDLKVIRKLDGFLKRVGTAKFNAEKSDLALYDNFKQLSFIVISGIDCYILNFQLLRVHLNQAGFADAMQRQLHQEGQTKIAEAKAKGPKEVRRNGNRWEYVYEGFVEISDEGPIDVPAS